MSTRDRLEVRVRAVINSTIRVPRWRRAAAHAVTRLRAEKYEGGWVEGLERWRRHETTPELRDAALVIEEQRSMMLLDSLMVRPGQDIANACNKMSIPAEYGRLLYWLVKASEAESILEMGTALGFSTAYMAAALPPDGKIVTVERLEVLANRASEMFEAAGVSDRIDLRVGDFNAVSANLPAELTFDAMFKDGTHTAEATLRFFGESVPKCRTGALMIFDDLDYGGGMDTAWEYIRQAGEVDVAVSLGRTGIVALK